MRIFRKLVASLVAVVQVLPRVAAGASPYSEHEDRGELRISVGASVIGPVKSRIGVNGRQVRQLSGFGTSLLRHAAAVSGGRSRAAAYAEGSGAAHGERRVFDGGAWFDPVDSAHEYDPEYSWYWRLHDPSLADRLNHGSAFVERTAYDEVVETVEISDVGGGLDLVSESSEWMPGLRIELAYEIYRSNRENDGCAERNARVWGVDFAVAFTYFFQRELWKCGGKTAEAAVQGGEDKGYWEWWNDSYDEVKYYLDSPYWRRTQFDGEMWGAGTFEGPGTTLAVEPWRYRDVPDVAGSSTWSSSHSLRYYGDGDYREYAIELIARPWWEPYDWLRVFASVGVEISRREFEWWLDARGTEGSRYQEGGAAADWRALGLLGGGLAVQWEGFSLAGEALWRFGGDDLDVDGRTVHGGIAHGDWGFRLSLGYEF